MVQFLAEILAELGRPDGIRSSDRIGDLKGAAADAFAELNGWKRSPAAHRFVIEATGRQSEIFYRHGHYSHAFFDHPIKFRERLPPYRPIAIVGQPYDLPRGEIAFRGKLGTREMEPLDWHVAPGPLASIHFPGSCYFCVVVRRGTPVKWLPEQSDTRGYAEPTQAA
jgi:hypothetical protein